MSFGNKSAVKNHLSSKHELLAHKLFEEEPRDRISEFVCVEEHSAERGPPPELEEPVVHSS
jgi:hypothetical protein